MHPQKASDPEEDHLDEEQKWRRDLWKYIPNKGATTTKQHKETGTRISLYKRTSTTGHKQCDSVN